MVQNMIWLIITDTSDELDDINVKRKYKESRNIW